MRANMREFSETSTSTIRFRARLEEELRRVYGEGLDARQARVAELEAAFVKVHALMIYDNAESLDEAYEIVSGITSGKPTASVSTAGTEVIDGRALSEAKGLGAEAPGPTSVMGEILSSAWVLDKVRAVLRDVPSQPSSTGEK